MHIQFAELPVFDQDRAKAFYTEHLACHVIADQPMGDSGWRWIELAFPFAVTNLHFVKRADDAPGAEPVMVLVDDDVEATSRREVARRRNNHRAAGGAMAAGPHRRRVPRQRGQPHGCRQQMSGA